ncbi:hypothetical protein BDR26DRAFT_848931 [Obelidium mucronatum]|nr:hypothetical protein BDR26DRAFT_848931 [Obelidium mucronatum]
MATLESLPQELRMKIARFLHPISIGPLSEVSNAFRFLRNDVVFAISHLKLFSKKPLDVTSPSKLNLNYVAAHVILFQSFSSVARFHLTQPQKRSFGFPILCRLKKCDQLYDLMNAENGYALKWACAWGERDAVGLILSGPCCSPTILKEAFELSTSFRRKDIAILLAQLIKRIEGQ